jgi:hypothetical protein
LCCIKSLLPAILSDYISIGNRGIFSSSPST